MDMTQYNQAMKPGYFAHWNAEEQARIDRDIEANRKADGVFEHPEIAKGTEIRVRQVSHDFIFGAHIFNFNQLGTHERNEKYKALFGSLFNSATIAFYWKKLELEEGHPRFESEFRDSEEFWNTIPDPKNQPHWRRPATEDVVRFCEQKGIRRHGHTLVWGNVKWQYPEWLTAKLPAPWNKKLLPIEGDVWSMESLFGDLTAEQLEKMFPDFIQEVNRQVASRIMTIALRYGKRIQSWDVVNESAIDFGNGRMVENSGLCRSVYGIMPGDYTYRSFKIAEGVFPRNALLNINDWNMTESYPAQVDDLLKRGCKIDIMGAQMHLFDPQICLDIADGVSTRQSPAEVRETMDRISRPSLPLHLSEITITAPNNDERGQAIQAVITRNLYRLWFSLKPMMGITWWNVVDDCGAPGEPSVSGLYTRNMEPKPAAFVLDDLIKHEWNTNLELRAEENGRVEFRGFRGKYLISWEDKNGCEHLETMYLK